MMVLLFLIIALAEGRHLKGTVDHGGEGETVVNLHHHRRRRVEELFADHENDDLVKAFVGYNSTYARQHVEALANVTQDFDEIHAVAIEATVANLLVLEQEYDVDYIEKDEDLFLMAEIVPYGIQLTQGDEEMPASSSSASGSGDCSDEESFKVAIVDSGIYAGHKDLPCSSQNDPGCRGQSFGTSSPWYRDLAGHGTHVAGTIGALGTNNEGIVGMVKDKKLCYLIARTFGDQDGAASFSAILQAVRWAVLEGAKVINMSLGGGGYSITADRFYRQIFEEYGAIVVAASGNNGSSQKSYPSSYSYVLSVGAVDRNLEKARFSQYNEMVDFAAPGVDILSTLPLGQGSLAYFEVDGSSLTIQANLLQYSVDTQDGGTRGTLVFCSNLGKDPCPGNGGHVCVIERGEVTFEEKALNCQTGGGAAAIIVNYADQDFSGQLSSDSQVTIPVIAVRRSVGQTLTTHLGSSVTIHAADGYGRLSGTSMATPHVTGALVSMWRGCPECSHVQVVECLARTAIDLGQGGKDERFGYGLVQARDAHSCLVDTCCGE